MNGFEKKNEKILSDLYILVSEIGENLFDYFTVEGFLYHWGLCTFTTVNQIVREIMQELM